MKEFDEWGGADERVDHDRRRRPRGTGVPWVAGVARRCELARSVESSAGGASRRRHPRTDRRARAARSGESQRRDSCRSGHRVSPVAVVSHEGGSGLLRSLTRRVVDGDVLVSAGTGSARRSRG